MATLLQEFTEFVATLNRRRLAYAVCGGWAMTIHGCPRATMDIDVMVLPDDLAQAWQVALDLGYSVEGLPLNFHDGAVEIKRISKIDGETKILFTIDFLLVTEATQQIWRDRAVRPVQRDSLLHGSGFQRCRELRCERQRTRRHDHRDLEPGLHAV